MTIFQANRGLVEGDLEWLRATIDARRMDIRIVNSGIAMMQNDRINRILQALASISNPEEGAASGERRCLDCGVRCWTRLCVGCNQSPTAPATQAEPPDIEAIKKAAYKQGWNDREEDFLVGLDRIGPAPAQAEREAVERLQAVASIIERPSPTGDDRVLVDADVAAQHAVDIRLLLSVLENRSGGPK